MAGLENIGLVTGPGGLFATRLVKEWGGLATNPPCDKPIEDYSTYPTQRPATRVCNRGPATKVCNRGGGGGAEGGGDRGKPLFRDIAICAYLFLSIYLSSNSFIYTNIYILTYVYSYVYIYISIYPFLHVYVCLHR